jgi:transcriptional regulator with XRE-family HTH domain
MSADLDRRIDVFYGHVGRKLRQQRKRAGMTQLDLAQAVDMTRSSIANLEAGRQRIPLHLLVWISEVLSTSVADLLPGSVLFVDESLLGDVTDRITIEDQRMRDFVQSTIAKVAVASRKGT